MDEYTLTTRTRTIYGIELSWERKERYGSERVYPSHSPRAGEQMYPDRQPTGTVIDSGTVFVPLSILEELLDVENSYGMGGAYLINSSHVGYALDLADLATQETRGGWYTTEDQRSRLEPIIDKLYEQMKDD